MEKTWKILVAGIVTTSPAFADDHGAQAPGWEFEVAIGAERVAAYTGSDVYINQTQYEVTATYETGQGLSYSIGTEGVGVEITLPRGMELELSLEYEAARDPSNDPILAGLDPHEDTWELEAVLTADLGPIELGFGLQHDILSRGQGTVAFIGAGYDFEISDQFSLSASADLSFANATHMNTEIGISAAEAARTGLAAYQASAGFKGLTLGLEAEYTLSDTTALVGSIALERYGSEMATSPLIRDFGSRTNTEMALGVVFSF